jgi:ABC-type lipoprotein export system ATPase subunit
MLLDIRSISKAYGIPGTGSYQQVLSDLSFGVDEGESIAITGPSGSGKTTLLNLIGTLDKPGQGSILYKGKDITSLPVNELNAFRNSEIGFIFQQHHLLPQCTLMENVLLPTLPGRTDEAAIHRAEKLIDRVGLREHMHKKPRLLSGGECQRTAVVRALINSPGMLLADEPTGALDHENAAALYGLLSEINREERVTLIVVTHSLELAAQMNRVYRLINGKLELINL